MASLLLPDYGRTTLAELLPAAFPDASTFRPPRH